MGAAWQKIQSVGRVINPEDNLTWRNMRELHTSFVQGLGINVNEYNGFRLEDYGDVEIDTSTKGYAKMSMYGAACIIGIVMAVFGFLDTTLLPMGVIGLVLLAAGAILLIMLFQKRARNITFLTKGKEQIRMYFNEGFTKITRYRRQAVNVTDYEHHLNGLKTIPDTTRPNGYEWVVMP